MIYDGIAVEDISAMVDISHVNVASSAAAACHRAAMLFS